MVDSLAFEESGEAVEGGDFDRDLGFDELEALGDAPGEVVHVRVDDFARLNPGLKFVCNTWFKEKLGMHVGILDQVHVQVSKLMSYKRDAFFDCLEAHNLDEWRDVRLQECLLINILEFTSLIEILHILHPNIRNGHRMLKLFVRTFID